MAHGGQIIYSQYRSHSGHMIFCDQWITKYISFSMFNTTTNTLERFTQSFSTISLLLNSQVFGYRMTVKQILHDNLETEINTTPWEMVLLFDGLFSRIDCLYYLCWYYQPDMYISFFLLALKISSEDQRTDIGLLCFSFGATAVVIWFRLNHEWNFDP